VPVAGRVDSCCGGRVDGKFVGNVSLISRSGSGWGDGSVTGWGTGCVGWGTAIGWDVGCLEGRAYEILAVETETVSANDEMGTSLLGQASQGKLQSPLICVFSYLKTFKFMAFPSSDGNVPVKSALLLTHTSRIF